jgi:hypothetical protein
MSEAQRDEAIRKAKEQMSTARKAEQATRDQAELNEKSKQRGNAPQDRT